MLPKVWILVSKRKNGYHECESNLKPPNTLLWKYGGRQLQYLQIKLVNALLLWTYVNLIWIFLTVQMLWTLSWRWPYSYQKEFLKLVNRFQKHDQNRTLYCENTSCCVVKKNCFENCANRKIKWVNKRNICIGLAH